ncbi:MAG TPA: hypothetical protein VM432_13485 [Bdellovibrionales bacterium]|nr:hypothetical protein [Bdellovibrionales bacterium]
MQPKRERNQHFGTLDLIMMVVLCGTVSSVVGAAVAGLLHDTRPGRARGNAEAFALQIRQQHENHQKPESLDRAPASVESEVPPLTGGQIGRDPWGRPYQYTVLSSHPERKPVVLVWSGGPNGQLETDTSALTQDEISGFRFGGDDLGYLDRSPASPGASR